MKTLAESFTLVLTGLKAVIAKVACADRTRTAFLVFVHGRICRLDVRFRDLFLRWKAGTLPKPRAPRPGRIRAARAALPFRLPRRPRWIVREAMGTGVFGGQLRHLLRTDPDIHAFLAAAPQAGRLLRPLCRMLGVKLDGPDAVPVPPPPPRVKAAPSLGRAEGPSNSPTSIPPRRGYFSSA